MTLLAFTGEGVRYATIEKQYPDLILASVGLKEKLNEVSGTADSMFTHVGPAVYYMESDFGIKVVNFPTLEGWHIKMAHCSAYTLDILFTKDA